MENQDTYSLKEMLTERFDDIKTELAEIKTDGKETKAQAQKTNGRVTLHDEQLKILPDIVKDVKELKEFQIKQTTSGFIFRTYILPIIIGVTVTFFSSTIRNIIVQSLSNNYLEYKQ